MKSHQANYDIRCEWGEQGVLGLSPTGDVVIIVDVLSFSTCVDIATARGATVYPYQWEDARAREFAIAIDAELAVARGAGRFSLSPPRRSSTLLRALAWFYLPQTALHSALPRGTQLRLRVVCEMPRRLLKLRFGWGNGYLLSLPESAGRATVCVRVLRTGSERGQLSID